MDHKAGQQPLSSRTSSSPQPSSSSLQPAASSSPEACVNSLLPPASYVANGTTTFYKLLRHRARSLPTAAAFYHTVPSPSPDGYRYEAVSWAEYHRLVLNAAAAYSAVIITGQTGEQLLEGPQPAVALLGGGITLDYFVALQALLALGFKILLLSNRNAPEANRHLLDVTSAQRAGCVVQAGEKRSGLDGCPAFDMLALEELSKLPDVQRVEDIARRWTDGTDGWECASVILHTSGTTGLPKPITHTNRSYMLNADGYAVHPSLTINNVGLLFPGFHAVGFLLSCSVRPTTLPPSLFWPPSAASIIRSWELLAQATAVPPPPVDLLPIPPVLLEAIVDEFATREAIAETFRNVVQVQPTGAALSVRVGKILAEAGVNVKTTYGTSEVGWILTAPPDAPSWNAMRLTFPGNDRVEIRELSPNPTASGEEGRMVELIVRKGHDRSAQLWVPPTSLTPQVRSDCFHVGDIFLESPAHSGWFYLRGRADDLLVHSTGEKTNAAAFHTALILAAPAGLIEHAVILGSNRPAPCAIIQTSPSFVSEDGRAAGEVAKAAVQAVSATFQKGSRILDGLVLVLDGTGKTIPTTPKGSVRRNEAEKEFAAEIDAMYTSVFSDAAPSESAGSPSDQVLLALMSSLAASFPLDCVPLASLGADPTSISSFATTLCGKLHLDQSTLAVDGSTTLGSLIQTLAATSITKSGDSQSVVKQAVQQLLGDVPVDCSLFDSGLDSLNVHQLCRALQSANLGKRARITSRDVYRLQTARNISAFLDRPADAPASPAAVADWLSFAKEANARLLDITQPPSAAPGRQPSLSRHVLLTGASGSLGCALLEAFTADDALDKVTCLVRETTNERALVKLVESLSRKGYVVPRLFASDVEIEVLAYEPRRDDWALATGDMERLAGGVTDVVAAAWDVNFLKSVEDLEASCIRPTLSLLRFCATLRLKSFHFISSVAALLGPAGPRHVSHDYWPLSPAEAGTSGYAQSKWLTENVLREVVRSGSTVPIVVHRVGQVSGHSRTGFWSASEAIPRLLLSGQALGSLPRLPRYRPTFLPSDVVARVVKRELLSTEGGSRAVNHVAREPVAWAAYLDLLAGSDAYGPFAVVESTDEWCARVLSHPTRLPAADVLDFVRELEAVSAVSFEPSPLDDEGTTAGASEQEVGAWLRVWAGDADW